MNVNPFSYLIEKLKSKADKGESAPPYDNNLPGNADLNDYGTVGFYHCAGGNTVANKPTGVGNFGMMVIHNAVGSQYTQIVSDTNNSKCFIRYGVNGTWGVWTEITDSYSASEHIVGKWIDYSPVYEKTIDFGALPNNTSKAKAHYISNFKAFIEIHGVAMRSDNTTIILPAVNLDNVANQVHLYADGTNVIVQTKTNLSNFTTSYITLRYIKTS